MLQEIWLKSLRWKHKSSFIKILNNKVWFSYPDGAWVTESRALRVLNVIARAIWYIWKTDDGQEVKEFKTLGGAKLAFLELKWTWKIWEKKFIDDDVEVILESRGFIDIDTKELNVWKFINEL